LTGNISTIQPYYPPNKLLDFYNRFVISRH